MSEQGDLSPEGAARPLTEEEIDEMRTLLHALLERQAPRRALAECMGKVAFASYALALSTIRDSRRKLVKPYHCGTCRKYHVGSVSTVRNRRLILNQKRKAKS